VRLPRRRPRCSGRGANSSFSAFDLWRTFVQPARQARQLSGYLANPVGHHGDGTVRGRRKSAPSGDIGGDFGSARQLDARLRKDPPSAGAAAATLKRAQQICVRRSADAPWPASRRMAAPRVPRFSSSLNFKLTGRGGCQRNARATSPRRPRRSSSISAREEPEQRVRARRVRRDGRGIIAADATALELAAGAAGAEIVATGAHGHRHSRGQQRHYSTVRAEEIRGSLRRVAEVVDLAAFRSSGVQGGVHEKREEKTRLTISRQTPCFLDRSVERETGLEPATLSLGI
jgi:hypothetical protein